MGFKDHLISRGMTEGISQFVYIDTDKEIVTFPLWSFTGKMMGIQIYRWKESKKRKYHTVNKSGWSMIWGIEFLPPLSDIRVLCVVEGIWDAIRLINAGYPCIAVLCNSPKHLKSTLSVIPCKTRSICDGDKAGEKLANATDDSIILPAGEDCNEMELGDLVDTLGSNEQYFFNNI